MGLLLYTDWYLKRFAKGTFQSNPIPYLAKFPTNCRNTVTSFRFVVLQIHLSFSNLGSRPQNFGLCTRNTKFVALLSKFATVRWEGKMWRFFKEGHHVSFLNVLSCTGETLSAMGCMEVQVVYRSFLKTHINRQKKTTTTEINCRSRVTWSSHISTYI